MHNDALMSNLKKDWTNQIRIYFFIIDGSYGGKN